MTPEEEYQNSLKRTNVLLGIYREYLLEKAVWCDSVRFREGPDFSDFDYYVDINGDFHHYIEAKIRRNKFRKYQYTKLPLRKHCFAEHIKIAENRRALFLARFSCGTIGVLDLAVEPDKIETMVARHDRGGAKDLYALYDIEKFKIIND